uniref:Uncharacterized protein n=1 Tax=Arundo donax TaxID=35708 RepID=A0A0A9EMM3_ARUDO
MSILPVYVLSKTTLMEMLALCYICLPVFSIFVLFIGVNYVFSDTNAVVIFFYRTI